MRYDLWDVYWMKILECTQLMIMQMKFKDEFQKTENILRQKRRLAQKPPLLNRKVIKLIGRKKKLQTN